MKINEQKLEAAMNSAYKAAGPNAYFGNGFKMGVQFALKELHANQISGFDLGKCPLYNRDTYIRTRKQLDGSVKWVCMLEYTNGWCLGKDDKWRFEPNPSSRTEEFLNQTRFDTAQEARKAYNAHLEKGAIQRLSI